MIRNRPAFTRAAAALLAIACARRGHAHQLDEYLQAARIGIEANRIVVEMSLTPGTAVAEQVFSSLDLDGDGRLSPSEIGGYARSVLHDVVLDLDERACPLTLVHAESASWAEMREGVGAE